MEDKISKWLQEFIDKQKEFIYTNYLTWDEFYAFCSEREGGDSDCHIG